MIKEHSELLGSVRISWGPGSVRGPKVLDCSAPHSLIKQRESEQWGALWPRGGPQPSPWVHVSLPTRDPLTPNSKRGPRKLHARSTPAGDRVGGSAAAVIK